MTQDLNLKSVEIQINYYYYREAVEGDEGYLADDPVSYMVSELDSESSKHVTKDFLNMYDDDSDELTESAVEGAIYLLRNPFDSLDIEVEKYPGKKGGWKMYAKEEEFSREAGTLHFYSETVNLAHSDGAVQIEMELTAREGWDWTIAELMEIWSVISGKEIKPVEVDLKTAAISDDELRIEQLEMEFESYLMHHPDAPRDYMTISIILGKSDEYYALLEKFGEL